MTLKRFYRETAVDTSDGLVTVTLDGRPVRTPLRRAMHLPTETLAEAIAAEWDAQIDVVAPATMAMTQFASTAIDRVADRRAAVIDDIAAYGATDLLCFRADGPAGLVARQAKAWQPPLDWAARRLGAALAVTEGVIAVEQPPRALSALRTAVADQDEFGLAALHNLTTTLGSIILALAIEQQEIDAETAWRASIVDELWQSERWGHDEEVEARQARSRDSIHSAARFLSLLRA